MNAAEFKELRKKLGLTQAQAGELLGYSRQQIINWECGKYAVNKSAGLVLKLLTLINKKEKEKIIYPDNIDNHLKNS